MISEALKIKIHELTNVSFKAKSIASRLNYDSDRMQVTATSETIEGLKAELARMVELVNDLKASLSQPEDIEAVFTDEQARNFTDGLDKTLTELSPAMIISAYDYEYLSHYPNNIRILICLTLINNFTKRKLSPISLWCETISRHGALD